MGLVVVPCVQRMLAVVQDGAKGEPPHDGGTSPFLQWSKNRRSLTFSCRLSERVPKGPPVRTRGLLGQWLIVAIHEADGQFCCAACAESSGATDARRLALCTDNPMPCDRSLSYIHALSDVRNEKQSVGLGADGSFWLLAWSYIVDIYIYIYRFTQNR